MIRILAIALLMAVPMASPLAGNRSQPAELTASTSVDKATQFTIYNYKLGNPKTNIAPLDTLTIAIPPGVDTLSSVTSPPGWQAFYSQEDGILMWAAIGYFHEEPDESGDIPPSDYAIAPGGSLAGFSFKSYSQPNPVTAYIQSYAPLPTITSDDDDFIDISQSTLPVENSFMTSTTGPTPLPTWDGNRRPAVDGFLVFVNAQPRTVFEGSAMIVLRLGSAGETVDASTLRIELNRRDVTDSFVFLPEYNGYVGVFAPGSSPAKIGSNVLVTSVDGIEPGGTRKVSDTDRLVFDITP